MLSAANWAHRLHTRGNFDAYAQVSSSQKWLEVHGHEHYAEFYTDYGVDLQKRFFGHFLKGEATGWEDQPPVRLNVRHLDGSFEGRDEQEWPLARTQWTRFHLDADVRSDEPGRTTGRGHGRVCGARARCRLLDRAADRAVGDHRDRPRRGYVCPPPPPTPT